MTRVLRHTDQADGRVILGRPAPIGRVVSSIAEDRARAMSTQELSSIAERQQATIQELQEQLSHAAHRGERLEAELAELRRDLQDAHERAAEQGLREGMEKARVESSRQLELQIAAWRRSIEEMLEGNEARWQAQRTEFAEVVSAAVVRMLGESWGNPQLARAAVEQVLKDGGITAPLRVLLSPQQFTQLAQSAAGQLAWFRDRRIELAPDERIKHGGCMIESARGVTDARFEVQLEKLRQIVAGYYGVARS